MDHEDASRRLGLKEQIGQEGQSVDTSSARRLGDRRVAQRRASAAPSDWSARIDGFPEGVDRPVVRRRDALFRRALAVSDTFAALASLVLALVLFDGESLGQVAPVLAGLPLVVLANKALGLYDRDEHLLSKNTLDEVPRLFQVSVLMAFVVSVSSPALLGDQLRPLAAVALAGALFLTLTGGRVTARGLIQRATPAERCVVIGSARAAGRLVRKLEESPAVNADVVGRVALHRGPDVEMPDGPPTLGDVLSLADILERHRFDRAIIVPDTPDSDEMLHAIRLAKALGIKVSVVPRLLEAVGSSAAFDEVDGVTLLGVRSYGLTKSSNLLKRTVDVIGASATLIVVAPLLAGIALAVKLDSRGPVLFRQRRIGRSGESFDMLKFRSMVHDAEQRKGELKEMNEAQGLFKIAADPRITRVGRWLRATSLDELPQLFNVLRGDMALVGPRPLVPDEDAQIAGWERRRLLVRPGMTGLWQIYGSARIPMREMVTIDYMYGANWSIWLDAKILARTIPYVFSRRGM